MNILIVEDEHKVASFLKKGFEENDFTVDIACDGESAKELAGKNTYDLMVIDIILPDVNGLSLCRQFKDENTARPVIILTALGTTDDKISGFDAGADDYLVKPFEFRELLARVKVLIKRYNKTESVQNKLIFSDLELDIEKKKARRGGKEIELTAREFMLLEYFMRNRGRVLSRNDIAEKVWALDYSFNTNVVDVYVNFLRKKIDRGFETKLIHTRVGLGYVFDESR